MGTYDSWQGIAKQTKEAIESKVEHPCDYCGKELENERFLGAVHGKCARIQHRKVLRNE